MDKAEKQKILEELGGIPEEFYDELVKEFLTQARAQVASIKEALAKDDFDSASRLAHSIKGSSGNLRLYEVQKHSQFIELESKSNPGNKQALLDHAVLVEQALAAASKDFP